MQINNPLRCEEFPSVKPMGSHPSGQIFSLNAETITVGPAFHKEFADAFKTESNSWNYALSKAVDAKTALDQISDILTRDYTLEQKLEAIQRITDFYDEFKKK